MPLPFSSIPGPGGIPASPPDQILMSSSAAVTLPDHSPALSKWRDRLAQRLATAMEGVVLALVCFTPWAFGSVDSLFEMVLDIGIALVLVLWGLRMLVQGQFSWRKCPIIVCLASLFLLGIWQLTPLSPSTLQRLAPATSQLYRKLLPKEPEALPGGEARGPAVGPIGSTLSLYPTATRRELVRLLAILLLFAAVRNNLSSPAALGRLKRGGTGEWLTSGLVWVDPVLFLPPWDGVLEHRHSGQCVWAVPQSESLCLLPEPVRRPGDLRCCSSQVPSRLLPRR